MIIRTKVVSLAIVFFLALYFPAHASDMSRNLTVPPQRVLPLVFRAADGSDQSLSDYRGRFVLLNVWATWCPSCVSDMPSLDKLQEYFDTKQLTILPLSVDSEETAVRAFYRKNGLTRLPLLFDNTMALSLLLGLGGLPTTLLINREGYEVARIEGGVNWTSPEVLDFIHRQMLR
ncbi:MAG: TlpA disulfide reductase family protein [Bdellovibrionales bacterium]